MVVVIFCEMVLLVEYMDYCYVNELLNCDNIM